MTRSRSVLLGTVAVLVPAVALAAAPPGFFSSLDVVNKTFIGAAMHVTSDQGHGIILETVRIGILGTSGDIGVNGVADNFGVVGVGNTGVKATGLRRGVEAIATNVDGVGIEATGNTGVKAVGNSSNGVAIDAKGNLAIRAVSTSTGGAAVDARCTQTPSTFCSGVFAQGDEGVIAQGKHIGVEASSE